jgi:hypothetical protein
MMRASRSPRRPFSRFDFDKELRDMRRAKGRDPLLIELQQALQRSTRVLETLYGLRGLDPSQSTTIKSNRALLAKVGG